MQLAILRRSRRFLTSLVLADYSDGKLSPGTLSAITAAAGFKEPITVAVIGHNVDAVAKQAAERSGVTKVIKIDAPHYAHLMPENTADALVQLRKAQNFKRVIAVHSAMCKQIIPRAAAIEGVPAVSDILSGSGNNFTRPFYAGNAIATGSTKASVFYMTIRPTQFEHAAKGGSAPIEAGQAGKDLGISKFIKADAPPADKVDLTTAQSVVAGGRGIKAAENFKLLYDLAAKLPNAAVGATRAVVDAGMCSYDMQVGQTGKIVAPQLYIGIGLSGAIQHLAGMKDSKVIVAINTDPEAPIFSVADYALEADLFKAVPELTAAL